MSGDQPILESSEISNTTALLERLTQIVTLQQTQMSQLMSLHQTSQQIIPTDPTLVTIEGSSSYISVKLDGSNYSIWSQVVKMHLKGRDKMRYITSDSPPPLPSDPAYRKWSIEDSTVKGWLLESLDTKLMENYIHCETVFELWKTLATTFYDGNDEASVFDLNRRVTRFKQSGKPVKEYYNTVQGLWREIDFRRPNSMVCAVDIEKFNVYIEKTRVYTFLDGLDDRLDSIRASMLQISPFPTVEQAYEVLRREAIRQSVMLKGEE
jgi:gag-polypeptide of LTR copia-type